MNKVISLHQHISHFKECEPTIFKALGISIRSKHFIHIKVRSHNAHKINIVKAVNPFRVIQNQRGIFPFSVNETSCQTLYLCHVMGNIFFCEHFTHIRFARWVTNQSRCPTNNKNTPMPFALQVTEHHQCKEMTDM